MSTAQDRIEATIAFLHNAATEPVAARIADLPQDIRPQTAQEAYAVQDGVLGEMPVAGWKILATAAPETFSCAAIGAAHVIEDGGLRPVPDAHMEIEVEVAIRIARDLPSSDAPFDAATVAAALGTAHAAFELVETRFARRTEIAKLTSLSDAQSNFAIAVGPGIAQWRGLDLAGLEITLDLEGAEVARAHQGASAEQIVTALTWLANHAATRSSGGLKAGQFVITGARIGPMPMPGPGRMEARVEAIGAVALSTPV